MEEMEEMWSGRARERCVKVEDMRGRMRGRGNRAEGQGRLVIIRALGHQSSKLIPVISRPISRSVEIENQQTIDL